MILHRPRSLELTVHQGIPVTPVARTIVDLADVISARALRGVLEQVEILRLDCDVVPIPGAAATAGSWPPRSRRTARS